MQKYVSAGGKKVNCPSEYMALELMTWTELHISPLNDPSLQRITVSHWSLNSVPGIARFRSALSAACCTETSPLSTCFSKRSRSWCMTPTCTIRIQLPSKEEEKPSRWERWDEKLIERSHVNQEFRETLPCLSQCFDEIETIAFAFLRCFYSLQFSRDGSGHQLLVNWLWDAPSSKT